MSLEEPMRFVWPQPSAGYPISREAELDKVIAAERSIAFVRLGILAFGVFYLLALAPPTDVFVAWSAVISGGVYSLWVLAAEPYRRNAFLLSRPFTAITDGLLIFLWLYSTGGLASSTFVLIYAAIISVAYRYGQRETVLATVGYSTGYVVLGLLMGQVVLYVPDLIVRIAYFIFVGALCARFSGEALNQLQAKLDLRDLAHKLERESEERQRAEQTLARHAEQLEALVAERTQALRAAKEQVETILNSTSDGIVFAGLDGRIEHVNPAFCQLFGCSEADILGRGLHTLAGEVDSDRLAGLIQSMAGATASARLDVTFQRADGSLWQAEVAMTPAVASGDSRLGVICSLRDVTERKQAEENLRAAIEQQRELNELKMRFVAMVSHEYRTPLSSILIDVDILNRNYNSLDETYRRGLVERIRRRIKDMSGMLDDVLTIGRADSVRPSFQPAPVDLRQLCEEVVAELEAMSPQHPLVFSVAGAPQPAQVDAQLIRQVVSNLASNAIKYSPANSRVELHLEFTADAVLFSVRDQGIGIPEEDQKRLFEAFHRAGNVGGTPGTGLGLAIVKRAVDLHHGAIEVQSALDAGTRVTVTLPLRPTSG